MDLLRSLYERSEGCDVAVNYDTILEKFRCTSYEIPDPYTIGSRLLSCSFAKKPKNGHILASTCENGEMIILNTKLLHSKPDGYYTISAAHNNALFSTAWSEIDMKVVTTSGDHTVCLWDVSDERSLQLQKSFKAHRRTVKTACFQPQSSDVFATGGRDGNIYVWDARSQNNAPEQSILNCHPKIYKKNETGTVTWLTFQDEIKLISCADADTNINVWDLRKTYLRTLEKPIPLYQLPSPKKNSYKGYSHMVLDKNATRLYASSFNNIIYCFNVGTYSPILDNTYSGHLVTCCYDKISLSPSGKYLASIDNSNSKIFIWRTSLPGEPLVKLGGQLEGLSDVSWCPEDELMIATSSDHPFPWIWTIPPTTDAEQARYEEEISEPEFLSQLKGNTHEDSDNYDPYYGPLSYATRYTATVENTAVHVKTKSSKRVSAMAASFKHAAEPELPCMLTLPNTVVDGYQVHVCAEVEKHRETTTNWLMNIHNEKVKQFEMQKQSKKGVKRKKSTRMSPGNNLNNYFNKRSNENFDSINVT